MSSIRMGEILRYGRPYSASPAQIDGLPNYFSRVYLPGRKLPLLEAGINWIQVPRAGTPLPAILISSSPHKAGSAKTPWEDHFRPDYGHIRYFGDNRRADRNPANSKGNAVLLKQLEFHASRHIEERSRATPILFFRRVRIGDRLKGNVQFHGFGIIERAERIVQIDTKSQKTFTNYVFDFAVFSLADENEVFDWEWINARRIADRSTTGVLSLAPAAWKQWIRGGEPVIESCRRRVSRLMVVPASGRKPDRSSREHQLLRAVCSYYAQRKGRFEALAAYVTKRILSASGGTYVPGWITPSSGDGGADFVGRLDLGNEMARVKLVVLGQAKCERIDAATGGNHIARTVARLRRGWLGVYVTTSYFSEAVQREVIEDQYPIMLIDGHRLATELLASIRERGDADEAGLLAEIDSSYGGLVARRSPEEILLT
jgi:hypothetical protein